MNEFPHTMMQQLHALAHQFKHEYITPEHLLYFLTSDDELQPLFTLYGVNMERFKSELIQHLDEYQPWSPTPSKKPVITEALLRVINRAEHYRIEKGLPSMDALLLLWSLLQDSHRYSLYLLQKHQIYILHVERFVEKTWLKKIQQKEEKSKEESLKQKTEKAEKEQSVLEKFCSDWIFEAKLGKFDTCFGRSSELKRLLEILHRRRKNNPIVVGKAGVGKTALIQALAIAIVRQDPLIPENMQQMEIYSLNIGALLAGTQYRGDLEERIQLLMKALSHKEKALLFIDDIHLIIGSGASEGNPVDIAAILLSFLQRGKICVIGTISDKEYRKRFENKSNLARFFQRLDVHEPSVEECLRMVQGVISYYADAHQIGYTVAACNAAVHLSHRYLHERALPDKALDILDEAAARARMQNRDQVDEEQIIDLVAEKARIPSQNLKEDDKKRLLSLESALTEKVYGQQEAVKAVVSALKLSSVGLRQEHKTMGSFLFVGPTGVGKTELCRQLSQSLNLPLLRFDMSEYMEAHSVSKWIGAPAGYVGYEQEGILVQRILASPYAILLLDEIEKAHPDIMNILLQIMDRGGFSDQNGRNIDCRHVLLILTSNVGASELEKNSIGFVHAHDRQHALEQALKRHFTPEFRNRLDKIIHFQSLGETEIMNVVEKFIAELEALLRAKGMELCVSAEVRQWLAREGHDPKMGARPMARVIERYLKEPLAEKMLLSETRGKRFDFILQDGKPQLQEALLAEAGHQPECSDQAEA